MADKVGSPDARRITANLGWRYLMARRRHLEALDNKRQGLTTSFVVIERHGVRCEAWNSYQVSKRILMGLKP